MESRGPYFSPALPFYTTLHTRTAHIICIKCTRTNNVQASNVIDIHFLLKKNTVYVRSNSV